MIPGLDVRTNNTPFLNYARQYIDRLTGEISDLAVRNGGPNLMIQVENEYGSYGGNRNYPASIRDILNANLDSILYTNDRGVQFTLEGGGVPGALAETNGDPRGGLQARNTHITDPSELGLVLVMFGRGLSEREWTEHPDPDAP
jgi:hypothetical protein